MISQLRNQLAAATEQALARHPVPGRPDLLAQAVETMRRAGALAGAGEAVDRIAAALKALDSAGAEAACRLHLRALCWAVAEGRDERAAVLDRDAAIFDQVLGAIEAATARRMLSASAWQGLLAAYFARRPTEPEAAANWHNLRRFLANGLPRLGSATRNPPDWLAYIGRNMALLSDDPCRPYAAAMLAGDSAVSEELRETAGIQAESWFWSDLVMAQVRHVSEQGDSRYLALLETLLAELAKHPLLAGEALAALLVRHHRTLAQEPHPGLRDFAIATWGNPHVESQARWALVRPEVKRMVREWIVREDLILFFDKLSEDRTVDQRRLDFWLGYAPSINFAYFVFGKNAFESRDPDFVALRRKRQGFYSRLRDDSANVSAVVMRIGDRYFVEFTHTGRAAYGYALSSCPFRLDGTPLSTNTLRDRSAAIFRESHAPTETWPVVKFAPALRAMGIFPGHDVPPAPQRPAPQSRMTWEGAAAVLAREHGLKVSDLRPKGGAYWVECSNSHHPASRALAGLGFHFHPGRGFWKK